MCKDMLILQMFQSAGKVVKTKPTSSNLSVLIIWGIVVWVSGYPFYANAHIYHASFFKPHCSYYSLFIPI